MIRPLLLLLAVSGLVHAFLVVQSVGHPATGSYDKNGDDIMRHHQKSIDADRPASPGRAVAK
ncbi:MAG: hypothetical protein ABIQ12_14535 [Opitutaceae bacterium]